MTDGFKSNINEMSNGFYSSRNQTANSYVLRSATKNNASRKQGVYSKFLNRNNVSIGFKHYDTSQSRIDNPNIRKSLFKGNEPFNRRAENGETSMKRGEENGFPSRVDQLSPPRNGESRVLNGTLARDRRLSPPRINESSRILNGTSVRDRRVSPTRDVENRLRVDSSSSFRSPIRNGHAAISIRSPGVPSNRSVGPTPEKNDPNSTIRTVNSLAPSLCPRVVLKRLEPEYDQFGRAVGLKRDTDGFLVPNAPNEKFRLIEEKRKIKKLLSDITDIVPSAEAFYFLKRCDDLYDQMKKNHAPTPNGFPPMDDRKAQVVQWLQSTNSDATPFPVPPSLMNALSREVLQDYAASIISANVRTQQQPPIQSFNKETKAVYSLQDWSLVKGKAPIDVMVTGDLMDISNQTLIEEGHTSSKVLSADAIVIQTSCCIYHLSGDFIDNNSIPPSVKKYFQNGRFPKDWREVIKMWNVLIDKENSNLGSSERNKQSAYDVVSEQGRIRLTEDERIPEREDGSVRDERVTNRNAQLSSEFIDERSELRDDYRQLNREDQSIRNREQTYRNREDQTFRNRDQTIRNREDQTIRNREDQTIRNREDQTIRNREDQTIRNREDQTIRNREDQTIRYREDQTIRNRDDQTIRNRYDQENTQNRDDRVSRIRDDQTIRNREDQIPRNLDNLRNRVLEDHRFYEREEKRNRNREFEDQRMRERIREREVLQVPELSDREKLRIQDEDESDLEEDDIESNDRIRFRGFREPDKLKSRKEDRYKEVKTKERNDPSHLYKKRKSSFDSDDEEESLQRRVGKKIRLQKMPSKRLATPGPSKRLQFKDTPILTRSARRRALNNSTFSTPKSSKRVTLKTRRKTPMPGRRRGRPLKHESLVSISLNNSDLI